MSLKRTEKLCILPEEPLPKVHFIRLLSYSLYNSWHDLKHEDSGELGAKESKAKQVSKIPPGHYTLEILAENIKDLFVKYNYDKIKTETHKPFGQLLIGNLGGTLVTLDRDLANLLDIGHNLKTITHVERLTSPTIFFIHCDLIDKTTKFLNEKRSDVLARFDMKGLPYAKVGYDSTPQQVLRDCSTDAHVNSITLSVKDEHGELFDFKGLPLEFELEIN